MPRFGPISRRDLLMYLRQSGFVDRPVGTRHATMRRGDVILRIPNPHQGDIRPRLLAQLLREAGISREEWEKL